MDAENIQRCQVCLTVRSKEGDNEFSDDEDQDSKDELVMTYEPEILWKFLKSHHKSILESSLTVIDPALHNMKISLNDFLGAHSDKFNNLMLYFYQYRGKRLNVQSAKLLIKTVGDRLAETTKVMIDQTVKPLTCQGVTDYREEYDLRNGGFSMAATRAAN